MVTGNTAAFAIAVLATSMAVATYIASEAGASCENYGRNVMMYLTTGSLLMFAVATFAARFRVPWHASILSAIGLIVTALAIMSAKDPSLQHVLFFAIACLMGVSLADTTRMSPFLDGSLVLAVILFAAVTATALRYGDSVGETATSAGVITYFVASLLYVVYLMTLYMTGAQLSSTVVIAAHAMFLILGCFFTLRALRAMETQRASCKTDGAQYPVAAFRLLIRLFVTIADVKAIAKAR